jgi:hypothetical protein
MATAAPGTTTALPGSITLVDGRLAVSPAGVCQQAKVTAASSDAAQVKQVGDRAASMAIVAWCPSFLLGVAAPATHSGSAEQMFGEKQQIPLGKKSD